MNAEVGRRRAGIVFWVFFVGFALVDIFAPGISALPGVFFVSVVLITGAIFAWVLFDSRVRGSAFGPSMRVGVVAAAALFVPVYVLRSQGLKRGAVSILKFLGVFVLVLGALVAVEVLVEGGLSR